jgi:hypothetical protein
MIKYADFTVRKYIDYERLQRDVEKLLAIFIYNYPYKSVDEVDRINFLDKVFSLICLLKPKYIGDSTKGQLDFGALGLYDQTSFDDFLIKYSYELPGERDDPDERYEY